MKKVLIISPHFPPINGADMHRVRQSLPYFENNGWTPEVLAVCPEFVEMAQDEQLAKSIPESITVHWVKAYSTTYTRKLGLGNLGLRAFHQLLIKGNEILSSKPFDIIYFSTTMFACMPLGRIWKRKFNIPFILDIQDPWRNDFYLTVPKHERPPKFWFAHALNSNLEKYTVPFASGILAVSQGYIETLVDRYPQIAEIPKKVLTFGAPELDFDLVDKLPLKNPIKFDDHNINLVYVGRGGHDMQKSLSTIFQALNELVIEDKKFTRCKFWFIGTSYAPDGQGEKTILPIAKKYGVEDYVNEITDRLPYFETLNLLKRSDVLIIPGSEDKNYTASKLYPNILAQKPMLCVFHSNSSVVRIVNELKAGEVVLFDQPDSVSELKLKFLKIFAKIPYQSHVDKEAFEPYTAKNMTRVQCDFFEKVLENYKG